jgi:hypothetical protein
MMPCVSVIEAAIATGHKLAARAAPYSNTARKLLWVPS